MTWRVGRHYPIHVYDEDTPVATFLREEDARRAVDAVNRMIPNPTYPCPTPEMLDDPRFNAIWDCIKAWDIHVPDVYEGYCGATGNHARAILDALDAVEA